MRFLIGEFCFRLKPKGSMCPNSRYLGLKVVPILVVWGQSIYYLGTWILWGRKNRENVVIASASSAETLDAGNSAAFNYQSRNLTL